MKKLSILSIVFLATLNVFGQDINQYQMSNIDLKEDSAEIVTIDDIVKTQQDISVRNLQESHFSDVWSRKSYINVSYNMTTLSPDQDILTGVDGGSVPDYKSSWGASFQAGRSYALHKNPIANILQFNLDYTYIDLNVNHFDHVGDGTNLYDSRAKITDDKYYTPWNLEKYDFNYGMAIGPSISIAPFTSAKSKGLHYVKFNLYYHIGYHVSLLYMINDENADANRNATEKSDIQDYEKMKDNLKMDIGHGLINSFGFSVTWKAIGIGYEYRSAGVKYKSLTSNDFGSDNYKFKSSTNRVFIQFRM